MSKHYVTTYDTSTDESKIEAFGKRGKAELRFLDLLVEKHCGPDTQVYLVEAKDLEDLKKGWGISLH